jgi:hypothetical protein
MEFPPVKMVREEDGDYYRFQIPDGLFVVKALQVGKGLLENRIHGRVHVFGFP